MYKRQDYYNRNGNPDLTQPRIDMSHNIRDYDYLSPVPFSEPDDPMGFYTRNPPNANIPRFLLEVRYAGRFLGNTYGHNGQVNPPPLPTNGQRLNLDNGRILYDDSFKNDIGLEFQKAVSEWV